MKRHTGQDKEATSSWRLETRLVRGGTWRSEMGETSEAMFMTSGYAYDCAEDAAARFAGEQDGYTYSRLRNPTAAMFEDRMALIEGAEVARATATGMAAVTAALLAILKAGDHVVSSRALFGSCRYVVETLLPRFGVEVTLVDGRDVEAWKAAMRPETAAVFLETPANPTLDVVDLQFVCDLAHDHGALVVVDNVFATPVLQKPMAYGADIVVYSATKHIDGQGRCLGGCILSSEQLLEEQLLPFLRNTGPNISPFNAWVMLKGLETLELRIHRMCDNAARLADMLADMKGFVRVSYPGRKDFAQHELAMKQMSRGGTILCVEVPGGREQAFKFLNSLKIIDISNNIGDAKSLMTHPASTTHASVAEEARLQMGITEGMLRLSVGLEHVEDLMEDLLQAAAQAGIAE
ncbi:O-succinylhomoserine sulfhydrylase [Luteithermobacter gelatinilyticus]|uniref:O-succinylhomoserine sulfhydrylase n=1 Tax=Luteithermobacter gelatinilyticus TaxID=2582913 RepID=UPI001106AD36|nr:O-succinylhomoserine sulfhydrylase [Luteithermobacter gelatinilyticus]|tara:strand:- start:4512 stop:5732 length:1221 start_codon:yes stop_codon:yes gene_type:complete